MAGRCGYGLTLLGFKSTTSFQGGRSTPYLFDFEAYDASTGQNFASTKLAEIAGLSNCTG